MHGKVLFFIRPKKSIATGNWPKTQLHTDQLTLHEVKLTCLAFGKKPAAKATSAKLDELAIAIVSFPTEL